MYYHYMDVLVSCYMSYAHMWNCLLPGFTNRSGDTALTTQDTAKPVTQLTRSPQIFT
jgi:hypothetical protein